MSDCAEAVKEADNLVEVFSEMSGPREHIVFSLCQSTNQRLAVTCKGDKFPFPFQVQNWLINFCIVRSRNATD